MARMRLTRLLDQPIIDPSSHPDAGTNIQGPSLIAAPPWIDEPLGRYYLYFADHKGDRIKLATADLLAGPWAMHEPGALHVADSHFLTEPPASTPELLEKLRAAYERASGASYSKEQIIEDALTPHVASPDVHVDVTGQRVVMYFHGLDSLGIQSTRVATSPDGLNFVARPEVLGSSYLRVFEYDGWFYGLTMPGKLSRSRSRTAGFEQGPTIFGPSMRHAAVQIRGDTLEVLWTRVGDAPESILRATVDLSDDWHKWEAVGDEVLLEPELAWEGIDLPNTPSRRGASHERVRQLRDPAFFTDGSATYVLYAGAGESGIGIAEVGT